MRRTRLLIAAPIAAAILSTVTVATAGFDVPPGGVLARRSASQPLSLGDSFTYQGRLTDGGGPANGSYDLRFILYDAESGGAQVGTTVTKEEVGVTGGLFTVGLDFGIGAFDGSARWMEIAVRLGASTGTYTVLSPRQAIGSTPYALYAKASGGIAVPFAASGTTAGELFAVTQAGNGAGLLVNRAPIVVPTPTTSPSPTSTASPSPTATPAPAAAIRGVNAGPGAGVVGETTNAVGTGGSFSGNGAGTTALEFRNGALRAPGGLSPVIVHEVRTTTAPNTCASNAVTVISDAMADGDPTAILFITASDPTPAVLDTLGAYGVVYNYTAAGCAIGANKWAIFSQVVLPDLLRFNVLVIKR